MALPRVLLVEDDASLRRFVDLALEGQALQLIQTANVAAALQVLAAQPVHLIITDLMMPGESGQDLLRHLQQKPVLLGDARVAVLSAGITSDLRDQLPALGAWRLLHKPVSLAALQACVDDALAAPAMATAPAPAPASAPADTGALAPAQALAIDQYFGGNRELFLSYLGACREQFPRDVAAADQAVQAGDAPALRRIAHSLKSVLLTLGHPDLGAQARELEQACVSGLPPVAHDLWRSLRAALMLDPPGI